MINLTSFVAAHARATPERIALRFADHGIDYAHLDMSVGRIAGLLFARGARSGGVVAILMKNSAAFIQLTLAISHLGAIFLPINFRLSGEEIAYILENSGASLVVVDEELAPLLRPDVERIVVDQHAQVDASVLASGFERPEPHPRASEDIMRLMYTSGTTDRPKGVMHSYGNFYWKSIDHVLALGLGPETRLLIAGPLYHVGAYDLPGLAVLWAGGMLSIQRDFEPQAVLRLIARDRLNAAWLAPVMTTALLSCAGQGDHDLSSMRWVIAGGERTPEDRVAAFTKLFGKARYIDAYGLTETCSGDTLMPAGFELTKIGSVGRPLMHVEIAIRDECGAILLPGADGEICLRGPKVTRGYWKDPAKTAAAFFGDWFRSGDIGYIDDDGFLFITDRKKDMIISGGENIASSEVERVIQMLPEVLEAAVIGLPDPRWGERPAAFVVLRKGHQLGVEDLIAHCRTHLAGFKVPSEVRVVMDLPRNPSGKVLKRDLRASFLA